MCAYWLKMIGTSTDPCPEPYLLRYADFARHPRRMRSGDRLILYAVGGCKTIFAVATVKGPVKSSGVARWPFWVELEYEVNLKPSAGVEIGAASLDGHLPAIQFGHSHVSLSKEEFAYAAAILRKKATKVLFPAR